MKFVQQSGVKLVGEIGDPEFHGLYRVTGTLYLTAEERDRFGSRRSRVLELQAAEEEAPGE